MGFDFGKIISGGIGLVTGNPLAAGLGLAGGLLGASGGGRGITPSAKIEMTPEGKKLETGLFESLKTELFPPNLASKFIGDAKKMFQTRKKLSTRAITSAGVTGPESIVSGGVAKGLLAETSARFTGAPAGIRRVGEAKRTFELEHLKKLQKFINLQAQTPILKAQADLIKSEIEQGRGAQKGAAIGGIAQLLAASSTFPK